MNIRKWYQNLGEYFPNVPHSPPINRPCTHSTSNAQQIASRRPTLEVRQPLGIFIRAKGVNDRIEVAVNNRLE